MNIVDKTNYSLKNILFFVIPSIIGIVLFMTPVIYKGDITIPIAIFSKFTQNALANLLPAITTGIIFLSGFLTLVNTIFKPSIIQQNKFLKNLFHVSWVWIVSRVFAMAFAIMIFFEVGPEWVWNEYTGGLLLYELLPVLFSVFIFAGLFLPLLLDFGLLEFFGALLNKFMRPVFTLPGRSSIDCVTSWLGDGTLGVLLTNKQYEDGFYTKREAAVIATTFSVVSITFSLVVISQVNLAHLFVPYYLAILLSGIVAAIIMPRIPPLSKKPDTYYNNCKKDPSEEIPNHMSAFQWGLKHAVLKAEKNFNLNLFLKGGVQNVLDMLLGVTPIVLAFGTTALILAENTSIFQWMGYPFIPILKLLQIPEAVEASQTLIVGFADMFLPSVIGTGIESDLTRFVIAGVSVSQLIYMSEVGGLILGSKIPVSLPELIIIFLERTIITLPIIALVGHIIF